MKEKLSRKQKIFFAVLFSAIGIFVIYNIVWALYIDKRYNPFLEPVRGDFNTFAILDDENYSFAVAKPTYPKFSGNLAANNKDNKVSLIIWPLVNGKYEYGVILDDKISNKSYSCNIMVDRNMNPTKPLTGDEKALYEKDKNEILKIFGKCKKIWKTEF